MQIITELNRFDVTPTGAAIWADDLARYRSGRARNVSLPSLPAILAARAPSTGSTGPASAARGR